MRVSRDRESRRASAAIRRDFRAAHDGPEAPRRAPARKDTRRWCRGVVGREHVAECVPVAWRSETYTFDDPATGTRHTRTHRRVTEWRVRCAACGAQRLPDHVRAQVDADLARRLDLAERWCDDGHLVDVVEQTSPFGYVHLVRACVMCGTRC